MERQFRRMGPGPAFVGRGVELIDLQEFVERAVAGRGGLALIVGEPGVGKTTLAEAVLARTSIPALWGIGHESGGAPPLWLWEQIARQLRSRVAVPHELGAPLAAAGPASSGQDRFRRFDAILTALVSAAEQEPFVVVFDDLQWADADSLALLEFVAADLRRAPVAIIATVRKGDLDPLPRGDLVVELGGLATEELGELVHQLVGFAPTPEVVAAAAQHTAGNPFFVGEVARLLRASGHATEPAQWRGVLPEGVRAVLARRLARLPQTTHDALAAAAVVGTEIDATLLSALIDVERTEVYERLAPAIRAGLLRDLGDGSFVFAHALVRDAACVELGAAAQRRLHERAAEVLEVTAGARAAGEIAVHHRQAGQAAAASTWAARAGDAAFKSAMYAEAAEWFADALADDPEPDPHLVLAYADARARAGDVFEAAGAYDRAARLARDRGDDDAFARAALGTGTTGGGFEVRLLDTAQLALLEEALAQVGDEDSVVRALLMARLSVASTLHETQARRTALADNAVDMARRLGDDGTLAYALSAWCDAHAGPRDLDVRDAASDEMLRAAVRAGDPELELLAYRFRIVAAMERGDITRATREIKAFAELADRLRQPQFCWYARLVEGMLALLHGQLDAAEAHGREAAQLGRRAHSANAEMLVEGGLLSMIARERGDEGWLDRLKEVNLRHEEAARGHDVFDLFTVGYGADRDRIRETVASMPALDAFVDIDDALYLQVTTFLGDAAALGGALDIAANLEALIEPFADRFVLDGTAAVCYGPVSATLARLAAARGDAPAARRWFEHAARRLRAVHAPLLVARVERELAELEPDAHDVATEGGAQFRREGDVWLVAFAGERTRLKHAKGMLDLAAMLATPGCDIHVLDLVAAADGHSPGRRAAADGDLGPALDATARRAYEQRIRDLTEDIDEAERNHDDARAAKLDDERAALLSELAGALGLSGRARPRGSDVERARKAVGMRVRDATTNIEAALPALGRHLRHSVRTGTYCCYQPEQDVDWQL